MRRYVGVNLADQVVQEFGLFKGRIGIFSASSQLWLAAKKPDTFWALCAAEVPTLSNLARRVFVAPAHSVASERAFSAQNLIHSKFRSALTPEKTKKLAFIHRNHRVLERTKYPGMYRERLFHGVQEPGDSVDEVEDDYLDDSEYDESDEDNVE